jgi:hypothetical protein
MGFLFVRIIFNFHVNPYKNYLCKEESSPFISQCYVL